MVTNEISGQIAMSGRVVGRVKVVFKKSDIDKVEDGDVLVTPMTTPDFLTAMRRSVAFVTDEGGITSHAAITSRELKKPCIIGTKVATKVLKDGDLVEVNANNGVVKILERHPTTILSDDKKTFSTPQPRTTDYQRLFRVISGDVNFLASDIFAVHYKTLKCFLIVKDGAWTSYIPKSVAEKTLDALQAPATCRQSSS